MDDNTTHEVVKKALRKASRQRVKKLGMKYDQDSVRQYRKSSHDHDHSVRLDAGFQSNAQEPPEWAKELVRGMIKVQERLETLSPSLLTSAALRNEAFHWPRLVLPPLKKSGHKTTAVCCDYVGITLDDTLNLTQKFWDMHTDPITVLDGGAHTLLIIQYNLVAGTLAQYTAATRPDLVSVVEDILRWNVMLLPPRGGSNPVNHALTSFDHVCLPPSALLGDITKSERVHHDFMSFIWRVAVGSLVLGSTAIPILQMSSHIARHFQRRHVTSVYGNPSPILSYRTQQLPLLHAIAQAFVLKVLYKWAIEQFMDRNFDARVRHGVAACYLELKDSSNIIGCPTFIEMRGVSIAEGDILGLSMRLVEDTLAQQYTLALSTHPDAPLALHESRTI
ncbi:hypothetical protein CY34DRAFT_19137 [Suillus luteus UH-Slu-Lm8-n1]|uniref:Unplaced genomic scaffold CY34scaffold_1162, whole genome shotgun sequence n=1 Tax=Suillus luteus UH-Slu-Lm8-n1 TaxID=930992 RepID=A0A0C9ZSP8_9AGAM|nr:hypothetical protein CY34DRAFT_19137 [Suillus luteus UH-Slu-Lm8-n1]